LWIDSEKLSPLDSAVQGDIIIFRKMNMIENTTTKPTYTETQAQLFKLLAHPVRIGILSLLRDGEHCVCHLEAYLGIRQSAISQQLALLREAGLVQDRRDGWNVFYRVSDPSVFSILDSAANLTGQSFEPPSSKQVHCCCPHCSPKSPKLKIQLRSYYVRYQNSWTRLCQLQTP